MKKKILASMVALALSGGVMANETSSSIRGKVVGPEGNAAANTRVVIIHTPSGTRKVVNTDQTGAFNASGLRVGGPYTVLVDSDEFQDTEYSDVYLQLGAVEKINTQLKAQSNTDNKVVVTGIRIPSAINRGSESTFGSEAIAAQAGVTRDIKDVIRSNPLVSILPGSDAQMTIGGLNPRFNSFTVDGISQNDDFGLNSGGYPTQRSPFPLDALDQITVSAAPFDTKVSGFSGGNVNAVFRSGSNDFRGSFFYEKFDDSYAGTPRDTRQEDPDDRDIPVEFSDTTYGLFLSGPLIKDKLFFMVAYENYDSPQSLEFGAGGSNAANKTDATLADVAEVQRIAREVYGLTDEQIGSPTGSPVEQDEKYIVKLDWNVNDDHRASFSYQFNDGNRTRNLTNNKGNLRLSTNWYDIAETLDNYSVKLYSDWNSDFSTKMSYTSKEVANRQVSFGNVAEVRISDLTNGGSISFGSDSNRHANLLDSATQIFKFDAEYLMGDHTIEFGFEHENISIQNLYVPNSKGTLDFEGLANFENRFVTEYLYENGSGNDPFNVGADFDRQKISFYAQDFWAFNDKLDINFGLRFETLTSNDKPPFNENSLARTGYDNTENLDGISIILPRVGFKYYVNDQLTINGGIGRYSGGQPNVWISNAYSQNGVNSGSYSEGDFTITPDSIANIYGPAYDAIENAQSDGNVSFTDPNFKLPSDWRIKIGADYEFDIAGIVEGVNWSSEALYVKKVDQAFWVDASLHDADISYTADGRRIIYTDNERLYDIMLTNSDVDSRSMILTTALDKNWDNGFSASISYTNQDITEVNPGTSSTGRSNYRYSDGINKNIPADQLGRAAFEVEHRFVANLGFNADIFEGYGTNINLFMERRSGNPFTYTTNFDWHILSRNSGAQVIGLSPEFTRGDYTSYIPTAGDPNVVYSGVTEAEVLAAIEKAGLSGYAGGYAPKGSHTTPWVTSIDLSINQEIPGFADGHKGSFYFIIDNLANLIDSSAGKVIDNRFGSKRLYDVDDIDAQGRYVIDRVRNDSHRFQAEYSTWRIKMGVRYTF
ncbi:TonB-dependent receptor [Aliikangiella sp. IMCC44653]